MLEKKTRLSLKFSWFDPIKWSFYKIFASIFCARVFSLSVYILPEKLFYVLGLFGLKT